MMRISHIVVAAMIFSTTSCGEVMAQSPSLRGGYIVESNSNSSNNDTGTIRRSEYIFVDDQLSHTNNDGDQEWSSEATLIDKAIQDNSDDDPLGLIRELASTLFGCSPSSIERISR
jgi:hypothetical protein